MLLSVHIEANTPEEFRTALQTLLSSTTPTGPVAAYEERVVERQAQAAERKPRKTKDQAANESPAQTAAPQVETDFQRQVREVAQGAADDDLGLEDEPVTLAEVKVALALFNGQEGAQKSREKLMAFTGADGQPVKMLSALQEKDFRAFVDSVS